ncbi:hypothetical protein RclHR1_02860004 [Rhizophagus clarus]|uniref:Uncharacterized protein n=1 Tax=Rhizophagus clarus TaxID=94130 RepID=A0A2Z6RJG0_9GLOM|nr:hypothetical protein RclHR1_02860004 [Rhizophagus clarus]GET02715.1 hypothetical protein GLOIN_2v1807853 [Rhizophagus clarus]
MDNNLNSFNNKSNESTQTENSNINSNDTNNNYNNDYSMISEGVSSASHSSYTNTPTYTDAPGNVTISDLPQSHPTVSYPPQYVSQYTGQNQPYSLPLNPPDTTNPPQINHSEIFTFDIPGIKIIIIPIFPPIANSSQTNRSEIFTFDIPGSKVIFITLSFR